MKDIILLISIMAMVVAGYFCMGKIGSFIAGSQRLSYTSLKKTRQNIIIATQDNNILDNIRPALASYSTGHTDIGFVYKKAGTDKMLKELRKGKTDFAIVKSDVFLSLGTKYAGTPVENTALYIVWYKNRPLPQRAGIVATIQNYNHINNRGYPDYS